VINGNGIADRSVVQKLMLMVRQLARFDCIFHEPTNNPAWLELALERTSQAGQLGRCKLA
jgi:hypothetical protein